MRVPVTARFPWPGVTPFPAGVVIPLTTPAAFFVGAPVRPVGAPSELGLDRPPSSLRRG